MLAQRHALDATRYRVKNALFSEMPGYLAASDIGILARGLFEAATKVNRFSSPIKVPEYLASGCPVALSEGIGDVSSLLRPNELTVIAGTSSGPEKFADEIADYVVRYNRNEREVRRTCTRFAADNFDIRRNIVRYEDVYRTVAV